jgi:hypothetical protein
MRFGSFQDVLLENHQRLSKRYFAGQQPPRRIQDWRNILSLRFMSGVMRGEVRRSRTGVTPLALHAR